MCKSTSSSCQYVSNPTIRTKTVETKALRQQKYYLKNQVHKAIGGNWHPTCTCGFKVVSGTISVVRNARGNLSMTGVATCNNIWTCPTCAGKIANRRREEIDTAIYRHWNAGGRVYMFALTAPHYNGQRLKPLKNRISGQWGKLIQSASFKRLKLKHGITGYIRTLEITYSTRNGWHPHLHILLFSQNELTDEQRHALEQAIFDRWADLIRKDNGGDCERSIFKLELCTDPKQAGDYIGKWGAGSEMTGFHTKIAKGGGFTPWALLNAIGQGAKWARAVFNEYLRAMYGTRQLIWSRGLKDMYNIAELTDEQVLANEDSGQELITIKSTAFKQNYKKHGYMFVVRLYESVENGTFRDFAKKYGITGEILNEIPRAIPIPDKRTPEMQARLDVLRSKLELRQLNDINKGIKQSQREQAIKREQELNQALWENERYFSKALK